jgi:hypothetical protein
MNCITEAHQLSRLHTVSSPQLNDLPRIFEPDVQLAIWQRPVDPLIADYLNVTLADLGSGLRQQLNPGESPDLSRLPAGAGRDALSADITLLADILGALLDPSSIGLRLEVIGKAMCPRLHVDRVGIRLLCTYRGPGSEWVADAGVDRSRLGAAANGLPDENSGLLEPGSRIEKIPPFAVALLKGSLWQGNSERGVIHRSPAIAAHEAPRVLLAMDAGWD